MLRNTFQLLMLIGSFPFSLLAQQTKGYEITGYLNGLKEGEKVIAVALTPGSWDLDRRDSSYVKDGTFHISGVVPEGPREYRLEFDKHRTPLLHLSINNGENIILRCKRDIGTFHQSYMDNYVVVEGGWFNSSEAALMPAFFLYDRSIIDLKNYANRIVDSIGLDGPLLDGIFGSVDQVNKSFCLEIFNYRPNQLDSEIIIANLMLVYPLIERSGHASYLVDRYNQLSEQEKNSFYGKILKNYVPLCVGQPFPDFTLPAADGKFLTLKEVTGKSKLTLVHFWAANSYKRKEIQDELRNLYKKYHDKGLNIIGFSSDKFADEWKDMLQKEQFPWYNVSDPKGREGMVEKVYHEYGDDPLTHNTTNVLIDSQGRIVGWDVRGVELKYLLWKHFGE